MLKSKTLTPPLDRTELRWFGLSFLVLTILGILVFFQNYIKYAATVEHFSISLSLLYNLIVFSTYALLVPLAIKVADRFPIGKGVPVSHFLLHITFSISFGLIHMLFCNLVLYLIDLSSSPIFPRFIMKYVTNVAHLHLLAYWIILGFVSKRKKQSKVADDTLKRFVIKENNTTSFLELDEVHWIEALDHYQKLHTNNGFSIYKDSISNLVKQLPKDKFQRIHRSTIVNVNQVVALKKTANQLALKLDNDAELAVGKSYRSTVKALFA